MNNFNLKKFLVENKLTNNSRMLSEELARLDEIPGGDLELKSLAKKIIPVIKKYKMGFEYVTSDNEFESKPKDSGSSDSAKLLIKDGILTIAVYFLSLAASLRELDMGSGPSVQTQKDAKTQAAKMYKDIVAIIGDEFELRSQPEDNEYGYYVMHIRKKATQ